MKLFMNETDIVIDFNNAKDKKAMIQILLDQNPGLTKTELLDILESHGCKVGWFKANKAENFRRIKKIKEEQKQSISEVCEEPSVTEIDTKLDDYEELPWVSMKDMPEIPESVIFAINTEIERLEFLINESQVMLDKTKTFKAWIEKNAEI